MLRRSKWERIYDPNHTKKMRGNIHKDSKYATGTRKYLSINRLLYLELEAKISSMSIKTTSRPLYDGVRVLK